MSKIALLGASIFLIAAVVVGMNWWKDSPPKSETYSAKDGGKQIIAASPENETHDVSLMPHYPVLKVVDGDTLAVRINGKSTTVRLIGLDTPETVDPRKPVQCFGTEASNKAKELLTGKTVSIETDNTQGELDKYGRLLVYVYLPNGVLFNKYMIAEGYGHEYTYNIPYAYQSEFKAAERDARTRKKGLWADNACNTQPAATPSPTPKSSEPSEYPVPTVGTGEYDCSYNAYSCISFRTQAEAQSAFETCGGSANDVHKLDGDKDGRVCESLP